MIVKFARVMVWSRRATISPPFTRSPSRTRSSPTTPPVGCCTFLTFESTTTVPDAISAPASLVVPAQPPTAPTRTAKTNMPARILRRIDRRVDDCSFGMLSAPGFGNYPEWAWRRLSMQHLGKDFIFRAEGHGSAFPHRQNQVHSGDCGRSVRYHDRYAPAGADAENGLGQSRVPFRIQIGIRFVQNHQERIAIERA